MRTAKKRREITSRMQLYVTGIPKTIVTYESSLESIVDKTVYILKSVSNTISQDSYDMVNVFPVRKNREGIETQSVKVKFHEIKDKKELMENKSELMHLDDDNPLKSIFIKNDEPPMTYKENSRLRSKKYKLKTENPNKTYTIKKGVLYEGEIEIDKFNLRNQIFQ